MRTDRLAAILAVGLLFAPATALAGDGYFAIGFGMKEIGRGGAAVAVSDDALGGANNPATMAFAGQRIDLGLTLLSASRGASRSGNAFGLNGEVNSRDRTFFLPEFGYNQPLGPRWTLGISIFNIGGINTDYSGGQIPAGRCGRGAPAANLLCGNGRLGVNASDVAIAPTVTYRVTPTLAAGLAPLLVFHEFEAEGLQAFERLSENPTEVTNNGENRAFGFGVRIGLMWKATPLLSLGATYQSPVSTQKFSSYAGLLAQQGSFDIPQNFALGAAIQATRRLLIAADYERIFYSDVNSVGDPSTNLSLLGTENGPGVGWRDINVYRIGFDYRVLPFLTLRAGYNRSDNPIRPRDVTINILAPGVITDHVTFGLTYDIGPHAELTLAYAHGFTHTVTGATSPILPGGGTDKIRLVEDQAGVAFEWKW